MGSGDRWGAATSAYLLIGSGCSSRIRPSGDDNGHRPPDSTTPPTGPQPAPIPVSSVPRRQDSSAAPGHEPVGHPSPAPSSGVGPVRSLADYVARTRGARPFADTAVMLTIDDGPHPVWTPKILRLLQKYGVTATFCVIGKQAEIYPSLVRAVVDEGHHVANHSYSHPLGLSTMAAPMMTAQMVDAQDAIVRAAGFTPRQFRSPGGSWSAAMMRLASAHDLLAIDWDVDPRDWSRPGTAHIVGAMLAARPGDVLLCHDGGGDRSETYTALSTVLPRLKARGLTFVTLPAPQPTTRPAAASGVDTDVALKTSVRPPVGGFGRAHASRCQDSDACRHGL